MAWRPSVIKRKSHTQNKRTTTKPVLRLPDLEHAQTAVLNSLTSPDAQRGYRHAINEFADWYCSEPRRNQENHDILEKRSQTIPAMTFRIRDSQNIRATVNFAVCCSVQHSRKWTSWLAFPNAILLCCFCAGDM